MGLVPVGLTKERKLRLQLEPQREVAADEHGKPFGIERSVFVYGPRCRPRSLSSSAVFWCVRRAIVVATGSIPGGGDGRNLHVASGAQADPMTNAAFDVVAVPDFSGRAARRFEILTLFFLASWAEYAGASRSLPLHLACIGEPPRTVRRLASACGAAVTSHRPEPMGGFANKLRGFEVTPRTENLLLLDVDTLVLSDLRGLAETLGPDCLAASPANGPYPASKEHWPQIYASLGLPMPEREVIPVNLELDTFRSVAFRDRTDFPPLYNGGVVFAPWRSGLGGVWRDHLRRIFEMSARYMGSRARRSNQPSLATAMALLEGKGFRFRLLPNEYNVRWQHITTGAVPTREARIVHLVGFGHKRVGRQSEPRTPLERLRTKLNLRRPAGPAHFRTAREAMEAFQQNLLQQARLVRSHRRELPEESRRAVLEDCHRLNGLVADLYDKHLRELLL